MPPWKNAKGETKQKYFIKRIKIESVWNLAWTNTEKTMLRAEPRKSKFKTFLDLVTESLEIEEKTKLPIPIENKNIININGKLYAEEGQLIEANLKKTISIDKAMPPDKKAKINNWYFVMALLIFFEAFEESKNDSDSIVDLAYVIFSILLEWKNKIAEINKLMQPTISKVDGILMWLKNITGIEIIPRQAPNVFNPYIKPSLLFE